MHFLSFRVLFFSLLLPVCLLLGANQCGHEDVEAFPQPETGTLHMQFRHTFGVDSLVLGNKAYVTQAGDTITFRHLGYIISNIRLINSRTGTVFSESGSYHYISKYHNRTAFTIFGIPSGEFDQIEFSVGVNEPVNTSGQRSGDLETFPWLWNSGTGYDFFTFDGIRLKYLGITDYDLLFKVQGSRNYKTLTFNLPQTLNYQQPGNYNMVVGVALENLFRNPHLISFSSSDIVEGKVNPEKLAENYATDMFRIASITR